MYGQPDERGPVWPYLGPNPIGRTKRSFPLAWQPDHGMLGIAPDRRRPLSCETLEPMMLGKSHARMLVAVLVLCACETAVAENVDPEADGSQYAYGENVGWLNAEPSGDAGPGVQVNDFTLTGYLWGENVGWVSLSCTNTVNCATTAYGVTNDGHGTLGGFAWGENVGWINFAPSTAGVTIDTNTGDFAGLAWGENIGWITFADDSAVAYKVETDWCQSTGGVAASVPAMSLELSGANTLLSWTSLGGVDWYELIRGDLGTLRSSGGDFAAASDDCASDNVTGTSTVVSFAPPAGDAVWFLLRAANCREKGTYDSGGTMQTGLRDAEIDASGNDCP